MLQKFNEFKNSFQGDPRKEVERLVDEIKKLDKKKEIERSQLDEEIVSPEYRLKIRSIRSLKNELERADKEEGQDYQEKIDELNKAELELIDEYLVLIKGEKEEKSEEVPTIDKADLQNELDSINDKLKLIRDKIAERQDAQRRIEEFDDNIKLYASSNDDLSNLTNSYQENKDLIESLNNQINEC